MLIVGTSALAAIALCSCANNPTTMDHPEAPPATPTDQTMSPSAPSQPAPAAAPGGMSAAPATPQAESPAPATPPVALLPSTPVSLANYYNDQGIYPDGVAFTGGIDRDGYACSSNLLGSAQTWDKVSFQFGSSINSSNIVTTGGQTIALPAGNFSKLEMLAIAVNGAQADQAFTVTYADNSTKAFTQSLSDWAQPDSNTGESQAITMDYRLNSDGTKDENTYNMFGYSFSLDSSKGVQSLKLPDNDNIKIFAITLVP